MFQLTPPKTSIGIGSSVSYLLNIGVLANSEVELRLGGWASQTPGYIEALYDHNNIICIYVHCWFKCKCVFTEKLDK